METQVLIPPEFSLVLTSAGGKKSREQVATIFSTARIPQSTVIYPFQGTVRTDKLEIYSYLGENDVSRSVISLQGGFWQPFELGGYAGCFSDLLSKKYKNFNS